MAIEDTNQDRNAKALRAAAELAVIQSLPPKERGAALKAAMGEFSDYAEEFYAAEAQDQLAINAQAAATNLYPPTKPLDQAVSTHFSDKERQFFESIDPDKEYSIAHYENGKLLSGNTQVKGEAIRDAFIDVKYHALDGKARTAIDGVNPNINSKAAATADVAQMQKLEHSLDTLEGYQANIISQTIKDPSAARKATIDMSEHFNKADKAVSDVIQLDQKIGDPHCHNIGLACALSNSAHTHLQSTLQREVIDNLANNEGSQNNQAVSMADGTLLPSPNIPGIHQAGSYRTV